MNNETNLAIRPAAFLDRDGTLIVERGFLCDPDGVELLPGAAEAVRHLNDWGYWVVAVSNQSGVARGFYGIDAVESVNRRVIEEFARRRATIDRVYYCPHLTEDDSSTGGQDCSCRKPKPGMIDQARRDLPLDLTRSFVVGDRACDIGLAQAVGVPGVLVLTGYGRRERDAVVDTMSPAYVADDLPGAIDWWGRGHGHL